MNTTVNANTPVTIPAEFASKIRVAMAAHVGAEPGDTPNAHAYLAAHPTMLIEPVSTIWNADLTRAEKYFILEHEPAN